MTGAPYSTSVHSLDEGAPIALKLCNIEDETYVLQLGRATPDPGQHNHRTTLLLTRSQLDWIGDLIWDAQADAILNPPGATS